jgi:putative ATP-dependent endonuclease of OLD family
MQIDTLAIRGFRCFAQDVQTIALDAMTTFVGPNSSGKTAAMIALAKLFGESPAQRRISPSDFHLAPTEQLKDQSTRTLFIECRLRFPELDGTPSQVGPAVPEAFNQMIVGEPGGTPFCRIRLEATWTDDGTSYGDVEQDLSWILTDSDDAAVIDDGNRRKVQAADRARIRVLYAPAIRDPDQQIRGTTATVFGNLLRSLAWNGADEEMKEQLTAVQTRLTSLAGIQTLNSHIQETWSKIYLGRVARHVQLQAVEEDPAALVKLLAAAFTPGEDGRTIATCDLSDGLRSLFSLSLSLGLFAVERTICAGAEASGFNPDIVEGLPLLTVFAIEEPENHLSPHYLGHIVTQLSVTASHSNAQVLLSSHSPSILGRVQPDNVRYFRGNERTVTTSVIRLPLPQDGTDEAFKYVREAIRGYPELYFSSLVILGEGPSEEIVLKHVFEAHGTPLDAHFISIVPLGGRHVNHFWRLLHGLQIPYLTLLDLDHEKEGAGWGRIQYVRDQLVGLHGASSPQLQFPVDGGGTGTLSDRSYDTLHANAASNTALLTGWLRFCRSQYDVFFSHPLDLDLSLLEAFPDIYKGLIVSPQRGPQLPSPSDPGYLAAIDARVKQVLAADVANASPQLGNTYSSAQRALFPWYKYFFIDGSKPVTHMRAMIQIDKEHLIAALPETLTALVARAQALAQVPQPEDANAAS